MRGRVDGLVVMSPDVDTPVLVANIPAGLPVVLLNSAAEDGDFDAVRFDNYGGAYAAVRHLAAAGHTRIAMITGPARNFDAAERLRGYRAALRDAGLECRTAVCVVDREEGGADALARHGVRLRPLFRASELLGREKGPQKRHG
jgi:LacI family transcriptional regulator